MKTVYLSTDTKTNYSYFLTSCTKEQKEELITINKVINKEEKAKAFKDFETIWGINGESIIKLGVTIEVKPSAISIYVGAMFGKDTKNAAGLGAVGENREIHYRNYSVTEKQQRKVIHLVNTCEDKPQSAKSAIKLMKQEYCFVWAVKSDSVVGISWKEKLKDKICHIKNQ